MTTKETNIKDIKCKKTTSEDNLDWFVWSKGFITNPTKKELKNRYK